MRVVFMGSPAFGLPTLEALLADGHEVVLVVSQPDRPAGRARRPTPPPVARVAREKGLPLYQPTGLRTAEAQEPIREAQPDAIVVAAFGLILPRAILEVPQYGCLNVHPSLLPRFRGASPIQAALLTGDTETGVTIMKLVERMDAGPILGQLRTPIEPDEDATKLEQRLAELGAVLLLDCLKGWAAGRITAQPQDESSATYCQRIGRADALLDWSEPAVTLERKVRAFRGRSDAFTYWNGRLFKVLAARAEPEEGEMRRPGTVFERIPPEKPRYPVVATGDGVLVLREVALEGRPAANGSSFLNGYPQLLGAVLSGPESAQ